MKTSAATVVPYFDLKAEYALLREEVLAALDRVCKNASFILGEEVESFEKQFAKFCEVKHCIALNSGTSALHLGLLALGVQPGDEVITSPNTFLATAEAITYCGARPVFVDIDPATANIDPKLIERAVTRATKAIIPVDLYGRPADMDAILEIAARRRIAVLDDACQAHGARYRGRRTGSLGQAAAFSFYPSKNLGAYGEGGALTTNDDRIARFARAARTHGQTSRYEHEFVGYNYRMDGFQGAVLNIKLGHLDEWMARRQELGADVSPPARGRASGNAARRSPRRLRLPSLCCLCESPRCGANAACGTGNRNRDPLPEAPASSARLCFVRYSAGYFAARGARVRTRY